MSPRLVCGLLLTLLVTSPGCLFPPVEIIATTDHRLPVGVQNRTITVDDEGEEVRALSLSLLPATTGDRHDETFVLPAHLTFLSVHLEWNDPVADLDLVVTLRAGGSETWNDTHQGGNIGQPDRDITLFTKAEGEGGIRQDTPSDLLVVIDAKGMTRDVAANLTVRYDFQRDVEPVVGRFEAAGDTRIRVGDIETVSQEGRWVARRTIEIEDDPAAFGGEVRELALAAETGEADLVVTTGGRGTALFTIVQEGQGATRDGAVAAVNTFRVPYQNILSKGDERLTLSLALEVDDDDWRDKSGRIEARLPQNYMHAVDLTTTSGRIDIQNLTGDGLRGLAARVLTTHGAIDVNRYDLGTAAAMHLRTQDGPVRVRQLTANTLEVDTANGDSDLRGIRLGALVLTSVSGTHTTFALHTKSLDVSVGQGTLDGALSPTGSDTWRFDATSGELLVDLDGPSGTGYDITADTDSGTVRIRCKGEPWTQAGPGDTRRHCGPDPGDPALKLVLETTSGNIAVREM